MEEDELVEPGEPVPTGENKRAEDVEPLMIEAPETTTVPLMEVAERPAKTRKVDDDSKHERMQFEQKKQQQPPVAPAAAEDIPRPTSEQMRELAKEHELRKEEPQSKHDPTPEASLSQQATTETEQEPLDSQQTSTGAKQEPLHSQQTSTEAKQEPLHSQKTSAQAKQESPKLDLQGQHKKLPVPIHKREHAGIYC